MNRTLIAIPGLAALLVALPVYAQDAAPKPDRDAPPPPPMGQGMRMMDRFDQDDDGAISQDEFADMGAGDLLAADKDGNGELSFEEIKAAMAAKREKRMEAMFKRRFDVDGDGKITVAELKDRQDKRFALLDVNNDGMLSPQEFRKARKQFGHHKGMRDGDRRGPRGGGWHHGWDD